jgi:hypothetical protein
VALAEAHHLRRDEVVALLRTRRDALAELHEMQVEARREAREKDVPRQFILEVESGHLSMVVRPREIADLILAASGRG